MGIHVVIVPGAQKRIDEILAQNGVKSESVSGIRVTPVSSIPIVKMAAFDVATSVMTALSAASRNAVIGNWVQARGFGVHRGVDYGATGKPNRIQVDLIQRVLDDGLIPILPCIGWSASGDPYNISSDSLAAAVATSMSASKLFFVTDMGGIRSGGFTIPHGVDVTEDGLISRMNQSQADFMLRNNGPNPEDRALRLVELARDSCERGVQRVHIIGSSLEGVILKEIFSNLGYGTMIHANEYESIRTMLPSDAPEVIRLMQPLIESGVLVSRSEDDVKRSQKDYVVYDVDGTVRACGALHRLSDDVGEVAGIAVDERFSHLGIGQKVVSFLLDRARERGFRRILVLTTRAWDWFRALGFEEGALSDIPVERRGSYDHNRGSRVLVLDLESEHT